MRPIKPVRAKKALGQHFLTDDDIARRIAATVDFSVGQPVLEVGPGMGVLTKHLLAAGHDLSVVEIDNESVAYLKRAFPELHTHIIEGDFLRLNLADLAHNSPLTIIGNYPYNISSQIFFHVLDYRDHVRCCAGMLQREVAQRIAAQPGSKTYGILSVLLQAWYDVEYLFTVDEHVFNPPPKVKSGVVRLQRNNVTHLDCDERLFKIVVKTSFGQRRKTLRNSLRPLLAPESPLIADPLLSKRPEQLGVQEFIHLTNLVAADRQAATTSPTQSL